ncbi:MAG: S1 RNA-binding domain-containing protein [cyanobacterium endosymbiont of Rhopalodia musculus]|uniref:S1 RNA-binding domain-containing protein n=1 Tax=cyanobacterium endosymbiont of Epithemia clementina EcSB TaxID=3034674 RepID=UPI00247FAC5D|nr:S1 RNA-binding domain-containing protein [cyanobacterium endosymbiont of Epithemia clementina EcSB]WGT68532.1 S1 RNA-binding domain-containing protein [cyanobacterium endosymbiont of Epithemia clementina EcSB]
MPSKSSKIGFSMDDFAKALDQHDYTFEKGQIVSGIVLQHTSDGAYVDIGGKSTGFVPLKEAALDSTSDLVEVLPLNEECKFLIISDQNAEGQVKLSVRQLQLQQAWDYVAELVETGQTVQILVTRTNKGGVIGKVKGLRGFIPRSHLLEKEDLESLVGQSLTANFLEVNQENNKLVLSQRRAIMAAQMNKITVRTLVAGKVARIQPYGIFVDLNGVTGLLHITQISGLRVDSLNTLFKFGQEIQVIVLDIDEYKGRISLSTKVLENYPGEILDNLDEVMTKAPERVTQALERLQKE